MRAVREGDKTATVIAALEGASYRDPFSGEPIDVQAAITILADWRRTIDANCRIGAAVGMAAWKRDAMRQFLWNGRKSLLFAAAGDMTGGAAADAAIAYWPSRVPPGFATQIDRGGGAAWQVEDGFIRSSGLGVECRPPMSVIVDPTGGIHYDPTRESSVEQLLQHHAFDDDILERAARLRRRIITARIGKYGIDRATPLPPLPSDRRIVLAVGQVSDDLSVRHAGGPSGTARFVERVRASEPDAFIIYRPHPDVCTGLRAGDLAGDRHVDLTLGGGSLLSLIERVDAVHVVSSLTGFEALLRDVPVTVHGVPFYAGWGLTRDLAPMPVRRTRRLALDALVATSLILAPRYRDPVTLLPCPVEVLVDRLAANAVGSDTLLTGFRRTLGATRRVMRRIEGRA
ncbi:beta-3-deoxy-D-manno-oct-2-ulosonic acid transferase [Sphingomonas sp. NBWT7]|uniref:capsular polysaccharide export protein, LipB/KpsS family n=1 Tax=Sphingomonas sp. NBWT7 TaxID=2596913 RepID=UPI00162A7E65|nr:beta-3-deoxy-D-manno-oct-2-ulosonic acid transferase [Sphingomonas sp. NBWT7]